MEVSEAILKRRSIRRWKPAPVEREKIEKVLEAGRRAPSCAVLGQHTTMAIHCGSR